MRQFASLSQLCQPFDEPRLPGMTFTDRLQAFCELGHCAAFAGHRLEIEEEDRSPVVGGGAAARYFALDVAPHAFAAPCDSEQSSLASGRGFRSLSALFGGGSRGVVAFASQPDGQGARL